MVQAEFSIPPADQDTNGASLLHLVSIVHSV